jgi:septal ring factor EnvC (AmiA/AmiB activator)
LAYDLLSVKTNLMKSRHFKLNFKYMRVLKSFQILVMLSIFFLAPVVTQAQTDKKADELKKLETSVATAKAKVALNERQLNVADSLITSGTQLIAESKTETKAIEADRKKLDKDNATKQKSLSKLTTSKDKDEASKARVDLKALDVQYRSDSKALSIRLKDATKMMSTGNANLTKGKATKKNAQDALKISRATLKTAQAKYDAASASGDNTITKDKKKK